MAPKKAAGSGAKAPKAKTSSTKSESKDVRWARSQLEQLSAQLAAGPSWLQEPHDWHQAQLESIVELLSDGSLSELPQEVKEGVEFYLSQFAEGQETSEEEFYIDRELYADLTPAPAEEDPGPYVRAPSAPEAATAAQQLKEWSDTTQQGVAKLERILTRHADSAEVQEAGISRLGLLLAEAKGGGSSVPAGSGLTPSTLTPIVVASAFRFPRDAGVQRVSCSVLRGIVVTDKGVTIVADAGGAALATKAVKAHIGDVEVCKMGAAVLYAIVQKTEPYDNERLAARTCGAHQVLAEALSRHPTDQILKRAIEVALPELKP